MIWLLLRRLALLSLLPCLPLLAVSGGGLALGGWLALGVIPCSGFRWPSGAVVVWVWGMAGWVTLEVWGTAEWYVGGVTGAVLMLVLFVVLVVPAFVLSLLGWDGTY